MAPPSTHGGAVLANVTVEATDALDCGVCHLPFKPPIFQCNIGHAICSSCHDELESAIACHVCRTPFPSNGGYRRCHAMDHLVGSIRVSCPNAAHGCAAKMMPYHELRHHLPACSHGPPCYCPADGCRFVGAPATLLDHFTRVHGWHCISGLRSGDRGDVQLFDGFNAVVVDGVGVDKFLFLLMVSRERVGRAISAVCVCPRADSAVRPLECMLELEFMWSSDDDGGSMCVGHRQHSAFSVACTDLFDGLPDPDDCFQFFLPKFVGPDDYVHVVACCLVSTSSSSSVYLCNNVQKILLLHLITSCNPEKELRRRRPADYVDGKRSGLSA
uniref:Uncharacterized protein n=1 Tax=Avena sativa TaxID=4498 RepID=A0ACD5ZML2_AVESA